MKATLTSLLLAVSSLALAADPVLIGTVTVQDTDTKFVLLDAAGAEVSGFSYERASSLTSTSVADNSYTVAAGNGNAPQFKLSNISGLNMNNFSIAFTAQWKPGSDQKWPNLLSFGESITSGSEKTYKFYTLPKGSGLWVHQVNGYTIENVSLTTNVVPAGGDNTTHDYIFSVTTESGSNTHTFSLIEDGVLVCAATINESFSTPETFYFTLASSLTTDQNPAATVSNIRVYSGTLVPEPATATLSLLVLAALAARRRRK